MAIYFDKFNYWVADHFMPGLINDDTSGLEGGDDLALDQFISQFPENAHFEYDDSDVESSFKECAVTGLMAQCSRLIVLIKNVGVTHDINDYCHAHQLDNIATCAVLAYVDNCCGNTADLDSFDECYAGSFDFESDAHNYLVDLFIECMEVPSNIVGYLDCDRIARDLLIDDYYLLGSYRSGSFHLFRRH